MESQGEISASQQSEYIEASSQSLSAFLSQTLGLFLLDTELPADPAKISTVTSPKLLPPIPTEFASAISSPSQKRTHSKKQAPMHVSKCPTSGNFQAEFGRLAVVWTSTTTKTSQQGSSYLDWQKPIQTSATPLTSSKLLNFPTANTLNLPSILTCHNADLYWGTIVLITISISAMGESSKLWPWHSKWHLTTIRLADYLPAVNKSFC